MNKANSLFLGLLFVLFSGTSYSQEEAPLKTFNFSISINKLKTEQQAQDIKQAVSLLPGVKACELVLVDYALTFQCTNHDMKNHKVIDRVKAIIIENGADIVEIKRTEK